MSAAVETMAYAGQTPWHGLGNQIQPGISAEQMLTEAGLDWGVETAKAKWEYRDADGKKRQRTSDDTRILFRTDTGADLSMVGKRYQPFQNREVLEFFQEYVAAGDAVIETAGSLQGGRYIWALADLKTGFDVGTTKSPDKVQGKVLLMNPHAYGKAAVLKMTEVRVVCMNTLTSALKDGSESVRLWHNASFDENRQDEAKRRLGIAREQLEGAEQEAQMLVNLEVTPPTAIRIAAQIMGGNTDILEYEEQNRRTQRVLDLYNGDGIGANLATAKGTGWGLLNAVTQYFDHEYGRSASNRLSNSWLGNGESTKRRTKTELLKLAL